MNPTPAAGNLPPSQAGRLQPAQPSSVLLPPRPVPLLVSRAAGHGQKREREPDADTDAHARVSKQPKLGTRHAPDSTPEAPLAEPGFHDLIAAGDFKKVQQLRAQSPALRDAFEEKSGHGLTPLCMAAWHGQVAIAALLLGAGAWVDARARNQSTPLMFAAQGGHVEMVHLLLALGADSNAINPGGKRADCALSDCALSFAIAAKKLETCKVLLQRGAKLDLTLSPEPTISRKPVTPLDYALLTSYTEFLRFLVDAHHPLLATEAQRSDVLLKSARLGALASVQFFMGLVAQPAESPPGGTELQKKVLRAAERDHMHVVEYLVKLGVRIDLFSKSPQDGGRVRPNLFNGLSIDLIRHADLLDVSMNAAPHGLAEGAHRQSPRMLLDMLLDTRFLSGSNQYERLILVSDIGLSAMVFKALLSIEIIQVPCMNALCQNRMPSKKPAGDEPPAREQCLQALVEMVSDACADPVLNMRFSTSRMTEQGREVMCRMIHLQRELLLQGIASCRAEQVRRLGRLAGVCVKTYLSVTHRVNRKGLYRKLTQEWGLYDPVAQAVLRLVEQAYARMRQELASGEAQAGDRQFLADRLQKAMTTLLEEWDEDTTMPEFGLFLRGLDPQQVDMEAAADLLFQQWRMFNEAHAVETRRAVGMGPRKPAAPEPDMDVDAERD